MEGERMSARSQVTECDQEGGVGEEETRDQVGSPERLWNVSSLRLNE